MKRRWPFAIVLVALSLVATPVGATVTFREDFESGTLGRFAGKTNPPGRVTVVMKGTEIVDRGNYAVKVTMMGDERFNAQQLRVQLASINVDVVEGGDTFMSVYMYVKEPPKTRDNFYYYEGSGSGNVMTWWLEPAPGGGTVMKYGTGNLGARGLHWTGNFEVGKWHQLAAHMHWGRTDQTGNIRLWFDGVLVLDKKVQTMVNPGRYFSQPGIHRDMTRTGASEVGVDSIYFDNFITADKLEEIELMPPAAGASDGGIADAGPIADVGTADSSGTTPDAGGQTGAGGRAGSGGASGGASMGGAGGSAGASGAAGSGGVTNAGGATTASGGSSGGTSRGGSSGGNRPSSGGCAIA
ncbi:MAG TPA: heparin lyase I family protein, partial [Polyangia bacterium]